MIRHIIEKSSTTSAFRASPADTRLCMIGSLQSRKAKLVAANFDEFHSLDSVKTAGRMERLLTELDRTMPALLEINVGGEASKHGSQQVTQRHRQAGIRNRGWPPPRGVT